MMTACLATAVLSVPEAAAQRRSIRAFEPTPIPRADLDAIFEVVRLAPSAFNAQPWRFVVVEDPELKAQLAAAANDQRQVPSAPAVVVLYTDMADVVDTADEIVHPGMDRARRAAAASGFRQRFGSKSAADREAWGAGQGYIALGYLLLAAEAYGYQTSPMLGFDPEAVKRLLGLPAHVRLPALVAIGKGTESGFPHHRHPVERIVRYE
jgi:nitroreductase